MSVTNFCILGERVSGTCMLNSLLVQNIPGLTAVSYNHKHFFQDEDALRRADTSKTLFIYITREPIAWLNSMCKSPYHAHVSLKNKDLSSFIRAEWFCVEDEASGVSQDSRKYGSEMRHERDPETGKRFRNVIAMRSSKIRHTLSLADIVENFVHVRLHDLQSDPETFLTAICTNYNLRRTSKFAPVRTVRGKGKVVYTPSSYPELSDSDKEYILGELDLDIEARLGYC